ncbi:MAG: hypothetical protein QXY22_04390 [Candidatus Nitrosotenuis sp.]|uniref:Uncharacterized protein n=1 Tax=Candidatus Nitrosotenuis uzonensis TaxID=1407055 RepID=V6AQ95_9ARCH|nr:hypothetical protein [Candidatus Nitrosotenuis uzonensis]CAE6504508.1 conserved membrane hypothetical protein [Candidatus Nitrosotenuis uzonensis]CDI04876.1 conserved membrane hypothetical protein [Candidatus Nitrosotenuis uzonensis]
MAVEKYLAVASLGLFIMFGGEINTLYNYLINPKYEVEPEPQILMYISIGAAPAMSVAGTAFFLSKRYGSRPVGSLIIAGGVALFAGMYHANTLVPQIDKNYVVFAVEIIPPLFMAVSFAVMGVGAWLLKTRPRPVKEYF